MCHPGLGLLAHIFNPNTQEDQAGGSLWVQGHHGVHKTDPV